MHWIRRERLQSDVLCGTFLNLGSATTTEIAAGLGFDWLLLDLEHGSGTTTELRSQLLAAATSATPCIVRAPSTNADFVKFVMDSGAAGIMFPYISSAEDARNAVALVKYPPDGMRGVAGNIRATQFGLQWKPYFQTANSQSLVAVQIETPEAAAAADSIAAIPGVDVLFVGPLDLSVNLQCPGDFTTPEFQQALHSVVEACRRHGKSAGILSRPELLMQHLALGFQFVALGSDIGAVQTGLQHNLSLLRSACTP